jgi:hypothetical protein
MDPIHKRVSSKSQDMQAQAGDLDAYRKPCRQTQPGDPFVQGNGLEIE